MIGQLKLLSKLNTYTASTFPHSTIFVGKQGSGKHTVVNYLANRLNIDTVDITENLSLDTIMDIYIDPIPKLYIVDCNNITEANQNILLKLLEEPCKTAYISLLVSDTALLLNTIINRALIFELDKYTTDELLTFIPEEFRSDTAILEYLQTPGQIKNLNFRTIQDTINLCDTIINKLGQANFANMLTITNKINFKDEYDKIDFDLFIGMLLKKVAESYIKTNNKLYLIQYNILQDKIKLLTNSKINKQLFTTNLLIKLWRAAKDAN